MDIDKIKKLLNEYYIELYSGDYSVYCEYKNENKIVNYNIRKTRQRI